VLLVRLPTGPVYRIPAVGEAGMRALIQGASLV